MAKRRGDKIDGWFNLDKPVGWGSTQALAKVRRLFGAAKAGHGGTLDPLASGVLPIALGEATKTVQWVMDGAKTYRFTIAFGTATATDDREGAVVAESAVRPSDAAVVAALAGFTGTISQRPPAFSALKIDGERAYDLARAGELVALAHRDVRIEALRLVARPSADQAELEVACGKGTYVRSLARDIALAVGTVGHVAVLRRTRCGPFAVADAIGLEALEAAMAVAPPGVPPGDANSLCEAAGIGHRPALHGLLRPVATALDDIPAVALTDQQASRLSGGLALPMAAILRPAFAPGGPGDPFSPIGTMSPAEGSAGPATPTVAARSDVVKVMAGDRLVAIARIDGDWLKPVRVLNL